MHTVVNRGIQVSRSLAHVALFATLAVSVGAVATAQTAAPAATTSTVKNHISDAERDRLMQEAMEKARVELEKAKAEREAADQVKQEREEFAKKQAEAAEKAAAEKKAEQAAAAKKAEEERLAKELAEAEKKSSDKSRELEPIKNLDTVKADDSEKAKSDSSEKSETASAKSADKDTGSRTETAKKETAKKSTSDEKKSGSDEKSRTVIETVSTREPGSGITVKAALPVGDAEREKEQRAARQSADSGERGSEGSSGSQSFSGQVVGLMRSSSGQAKILLQAEDSRMVQVMVDKDDVPAPGSVVSVRGRAVGGSGMSPVISATSIDIKSGQKMEPLRDVTAAEVAPAMPASVIQPEPLMMPPMPMMGPPMPMGMGPMGPRRGFGGPGPF
jgi:hypothetical protein